MKLIFLGVSAAFCVGEDCFQSNMLLISESGQKLLIDCGSDVRHSLFAQGFNYSDVNAVYVSHLHSDHTGGLEWLGFTKNFIDSTKADLYVHTDLVDLLWNNVLSGGMSSIEHSEANLSTYFNIKRISNCKFSWENYNFELVKTHHFFSNGQLMPSYGLFIKSDSKSTFVTTDTRFIKGQFDELYNKSDIIFHDCETAEKATGQHARYQDLLSLDPKIRTKIWLYDYNKGILPDAQKDGFMGFVTTGQSFDI